MKNPPRCCLCKDTGAIRRFLPNGKLGTDLDPCPACRRTGSMKKRPVHDGKMAAAGKDN